MQQSFAPSWKVKAVSDLTGWEVCPIVGTFHWSLNFHSHYVQTYFLVAVCRDSEILRDSHQLPYGLYQKLAGQHNAVARGDLIQPTRLGARKRFLGRCIGLFNLHHVRSLFCFPSRDGFVGEVMFGHPNWVAWKTRPRVWVCPLNLIAFGDDFNERFLGAGFTVRVWDHNCC